VVDHGNGQVSAEASVTVSLANGCAFMQIYGEHSEEVAMLRSIRDTLLSRTAEGRALTELYYTLSPLIAKTIAEDETLKNQVKAMVDEILLSTGIE
jgi:hypothetical protein